MEKEKISLFLCVEVEAFLFNFDNSLAIKDKDKILSRQEQKPLQKPYIWDF